MKAQRYLKIAMAGATAILISLSIASRTEAAVGDLDLRFGNGGKVVTEFSTDFDEARAVAIQSNGKIVAAGNAFNSSTGNYDFALARYDKNGNLDNSFGNNGKVTTHLSGNTPAPFPTVETAKAIAIQNNGRIVVAGTGFNGSTGATDFAVLRYLSNGRLDRRFGQHGIVLTDFGGINARANSMVLQPDGKIVVAGTLERTFTQPDFVLVRYNTDGSLDSTFGDNGKVFTDVSRGIEEANAVRLTPDGKILVGGEAFIECPGLSCGASNFVLLRYNANGGIDSSFGNGGVVTTDFDIRDGITALDIAPNGKIIAGGFADRLCSGPGCPRFALARYNVNGSLDTTFGDGGKVTTQLGDTSQITAIAITAGLPTAKIVVAGYFQERRVCGAATGDIFPCDFALLRYNWDGTLDTSFGTGGKVFTDIGNGTQDQAFDLAIDERGQIILAGNGGGNFALTRCLGISKCERAEKRY
ncbi:MAG: delta-60 repeat domain-containing protein [Pseudomonadota bacterium]